MLSRLPRPLNIAHRGANKVAPENTLAAFERALTMGAHGIELDVRLSADEVPVVIHDATVDATTDGRGRVDQKTLKGLKELDAGASFEFPANNSMDFRARRIPTLAEVLEELGGSCLLNIELKGVRFLNEGLERIVVKLIERHGLGEKVLLSSFNPLALRRIQRLAPEIPTALLSMRPARPSLSLLGLIIPRPTSALHPHHAAVDEHLISQAHRRGQRVHVWTVDDPALMRRLIVWDVDGIITNTPDVLTELLKSKL